jgi:hypothetical protein
MEWNYCFHGSDDHETCIRFPTRAVDISILHSVQTVLVLTPTCNEMIPVTLLWDKAVGFMTLTTDLHLVSEFKNAYNK